VGCIHVILSTECIVVEVYKLLAMFWVITWSEFFLDCDIEMFLWKTSNDEKGWINIIDKHERWKRLLSNFVSLFHWKARNFRIETSRVGGAKSNDPSDLKTRRDSGLPDHILDRSHAAD
jgi:hypothetical protein